MPYLHAKEIEQAMVTLEQTYSPTCKRFVAGTSVGGQIIHGLVIQGGKQQDYRPHVLITAGVHAREWAQPDAILSFAQELLAAYKADTDIVEGTFDYTNRAGASGTLSYGQYIVVKQNVEDIVNRLTIYIIPMVNPDGRDFSLDVEPFWRKNRKSFSHWQLIKVFDSTGGTYALSFEGATTGEIKFDANAKDVADALSSLAPLLDNVEAEQPFWTPGTNQTDTSCTLVRLKSGTGVFPLMTGDGSNLTGANPRIVVDWGDGVDINRNFNIAWAKEIYYDIDGAKQAHSSATLDGTHAEQDFRGSRTFSESETTNIVNFISTHQIDFFLDLHSYAGKILVPWAIETQQSTDSSQWFGNRAWDRHPSQHGVVQPHDGRDGLSGNQYAEWLPDRLVKDHKALATSMQAEITRAAGNNAAESSYAVVEAAEGLYTCTGNGQDYVASLQFLPDNQEGANVSSITFEAGSNNDGGFFPQTDTGQYQKVERDVHAGVVGFLLYAVAAAKRGQPTAPQPKKHA
jgi:murein tripeptide amidase MpaA